MLNRFIAIYRYYIVFLCEISSYVPSSAVGGMNKLKFKYVLEYSVTESQASPHVFECVRWTVVMQKREKKILKTSCLILEMQICFTSLFFFFCFHLAWVVVYMMVTREKILKKWTQRVLTGRNFSLLIINDAVLWGNFYE